MSKRAYRVGFAPLFALVAFVVGLAPFACKGGDEGDKPPVDGGLEVADVSDAAADGETIASDLQPFPYCASAKKSAVAPPPHVPWAIDGKPLLALEGTTLHQLHPRRGLLVFDATDVDHPKLRARVPNPGIPVFLQVAGGIALTIVTDVYDADAGKPFYGSLLRLVDLRDLSAPKILAEARLPRWVRKAMVVGDRLYLATRGPVFRYGDAGHLAGDPVYAIESYKLGSSSFTAVGNVTFAGRAVETVMTPDAIVVASAVPADVGKPYGALLSATDVQLIDLTNVSGTLIIHGTLRTTARIADEGFADPRSGLFFDGRFVQVVGCTSPTCTADARWQLSTVDFTLIDTPNLSSERPIPVTGDAPVARLEGGRLWLAPPTGTALTVFDLKDPAHPALAPALDDLGPVLDLRATATKLYVLDRTLEAGVEGRRVTMLDVTDVTKPTTLDTTTFEAPESPPDGGIDRLLLTASSLVMPTAAAGKYGIRVFPATTSVLGLGTVVEATHPIGDVVASGDRVLGTGLSSLAVVDARTTPKLSSETLLARDVHGLTIAGAKLLELSSRIGPETGSALRLLDGGDGAELTGLSSAPELPLDGETYAIFTPETQAIVVSTIRIDAPCASGTCKLWTDRVQVFDLSGATPKLLGQVVLPTNEAWSRSGDGPTRQAPLDADTWCNGAPAVLVSKDLLAIRRWPRAHEPYAPASHDLWLVDLRDATAPHASSVPLTKNPDGFWGNLVVSDGRLLATHVEPVGPASTTSLVRSFVDVIDVTDRASPKVTTRPASGVTLGNVAGDVTTDYVVRSTSASSVVVTEKSGAAGLVELSRVALGGAIGLPLVRGSTLYLSVAGPVGTSRVHAVDLSKPASLVDHPLSVDDLLAGLAIGAVGERLVMPSGWGAIGYDVFRIGPDRVTYEGSARSTRIALDFLAHDTRGLWFGGGEWGISAFP